MKILLALFAKGEQFQKLVVEDHQECVLPDVGWAAYQEDGDKEALANKKALFFRSTVMPSLASALKRVRDADHAALRLFADRLQDGLTRRLVADPAPVEMLVETLVLMKNA